MYTKHDGRAVLIAVAELLVLAQGNLNPINAGIGHRG